MEEKLKSEGKFTFIEEGEGPVLLLLHGLFGALSNWAPVLNHFSKNYKVIIPMMPIYTMPIQKSTVDGLSNYIHEFVQFKGLTNFTLIGNSLGGHVGLVYTLDHPDMVNSMILTGSSGLYENSIGGSYPKRQDYNFIKVRTEYTFYNPATATKELVDEVYEIVNNRQKGLRIIMMAKSAIRHNMNKEVRHIRIPVCLIWGKNDKITPPEVAEEFDRLMPNTELHWINECGHAAMMEKPEEFNPLAESFLRKIYPEHNLAHSK
ncbi:MAG: alpha/beta hydrolase [Bacteroidota bacterium]|nr:alpha/beta hydrolase [Bacteroidota bacterium]